MFLAQLDFDGVAVLPNGVPPGVLLSIYTEIVTGYRDMNLKFEWQSRAAATLATEDQIPAGVSILPAFQGQAFAAMDYVAVDPNRFDPGMAEKYIPALWGTKIGGVNPVHEAILQDRNWGKPPEHQVASLGTFLGTIGCVQPSTDTPWPFIDREEPMSFRECWANQFILADMGMIVLHVRGDGSIEWDPCLG